MDSKTLKKITDQFNNQGKMAFLSGATSEQILNFELENEITLPEGYKEWLKFSDGGECFLPAGIQFYGVAHRPLIDVDDDDRPSHDYIVLGALASGDPILYEKGKENIFIFNHQDNRIEEDEIYEDFEAFLNDLANILGIGG